MICRQEDEARQGKRAASAGAQWVWCTVTGLTTTTTATTTMPRLPRAPFKDATGAGAQVVEEEEGEAKHFCWSWKIAIGRNPLRLVWQNYSSRGATHTPRRGTCGVTRVEGEGERGIARQLARVSSQRFMASFTRQSQLFAKGEEELRLSEENLIKFI